MEMGEAKTMGRFVARPRVATSRRHLATSRRRLATFDWSRLSLACTLLIGLIFGVGQATGLIVVPYDFHNYWQATDFGNLYSNWSDPSYAYLYPPVLAQLFYPLHALPYGLVLAAWTVLCFASLWVCVREWALTAIALGFIAIAIPVVDVLGFALGFVLVGNVQMPVAAAIVLGMRHPGWFGATLLTKLTVGVGALWFLFNRDWRRFGIVIGVTVIVAAASFAISPAAWFEWAQFMLAYQGGPLNTPIVGPPLWLRVVAAILLVAWGARTKRPWVVAIAGGIAIPSLYGPASVLTVALGAYGIRRDANVKLDSTSRLEPSQDAFALVAVGGD